MTPHITYSEVLFERNYYLKIKEKWNETFRRIFALKNFEEWISNKYVNGEEILDGNPVFSALFEEQKKAVRIILLKEDHHSASLSAWIDISEYKEQEIDELVIALKDEKIAKQQAEQLVKQFVDGILLISSLELVNQQFEQLHFGNYQGAPLALIQKSASNFSSSQVEALVRLTATGTFSASSPIPLQEVAKAVQVTSYLLKHNEVVQGLVEIATIFNRRTDEMAEEELK